MAGAPIFIGTPKTWQGQVTAANTNRDGTGTLVNVVAAGSAPGTRIDRIHIIASAATTAGVVRLFISDGTNTRLYREVMVDAVTPSNVIKVWEAELTFADGLVLPNGWSLRASTHNAETFNIQAQGGDFAVAA
jgi:hypothetical protein